jgi:guanylate kinase
VQQQYPSQTLSVFIEPPSVEELKKRLQKRGTESMESFNARVNKAAYELTFKNRFHKVIINDQLDQACKEAVEIVSKFIMV